MMFQESLTLMDIKESLLGLEKKITMAIGLKTLHWPQHAPGRVLSRTVCLMKKEELLPWAFSSLLQDRLSLGLQELRGPG